MRIAILSRRATLYTTRRLVRTARFLGHKVRVIDPLACMLQTEAGRHAIVLDDKALKLPDAVLPRVGSASTMYGLAVLQQFEARGAYVVNTSDAISKARDKLRSLQFLAEQGVPIAATVMTRDPARLKEAIDLVGGPPVVLKLLQGTQGIGVILASSYKMAKATLTTLWQLGQNILIQRFISESKGRDIRALVVGGRVITAMRRVAKSGEFRSNIHRGGVGEPIELNARQEKVVLDAARVMGLEVSGVDLLEGDDGPIVTEVNASPGFEGLEKATGLDIARAILEHMQRQVERE